jgi:hypothetical protein
MDETRGVAVATVLTQNAPVKARFGILSGGCRDVR